MGFYEDLPPWRQKIYDQRLQKVLNAHKSMDEFPPSFWAKQRLALSWKAISAVLSVEAH